MGKSASSKENVSRDDKGIGADQRDPELVAEFVTEATEHLATVEDDILALERRGANLDANIVNRLFRAIHTIKGGAGLLAYPHIAELSHALENLVGLIRSGELFPDKAIAEVLLRGTDKLKVLIGDPNNVSISIEEETAAVKAIVISEKFPKDDRGISSHPPTKSVSPAEEPSSPSPARTAQLAAERNAAAAEGADVGDNQTVRIPLILLDKLMNLASELVLVRNQNVQAAESRNLEQLAAISQRLNVVTSDLQSTVMQTRMRPIGSIFTKFTRIVRDLARKLGKEVELEIVGSEVELDKSIVEAIGDPLTHLVRNSVDHGIELPGDRKRKGKPPAGLLRLRAFHQDGQVLVQIRDDGKGIDPAVLKRIAVEKGILRPEEAATYSDAEAFNLIFRPGFSTAETVTDVSGRGVGMDVVKTSFQKLGGIVDIHSVVDKGTTITIKLPLTLAIVPALIVAVDGQFFAIPQVNINEVVWLHGDDVGQLMKKVCEQEVYWLRGKLLPILRLATILGIRKGAIATVPGNPMTGHPGSANSAETETRQDILPAITPLPDSAYIVVLQHGSESFGLLVDTLVDTKEIVVKTLHEQLKDCRAFSGTTVLGDGRIALILDIIAVAELGAVRFTKTDEKTGPTRSSLDEQRTVLLFDVGSPERFAIPLCLITRVEEIQPSQIQVANQREYFNFRGSLIPLARIEQTLPRIGARYPDNLMYVIIPKCRKPFGVAAARILDTVEVQSQIDTKTVKAKGVAGCQMLGGRMTLFLDPFTVIETVEPDWVADEFGATGTDRPVLVVDDSPFSRMLVASYLHGAGVSIIMAENGREALEALPHGRFAMVLCDLEMPVMDGYEFARVVRQTEAYRSLPLLAISGAGEEVRTRAMDAGFDDFQNKFDRREFIEAFLRLYSRKTGGGMGGKDTL